ncbi:MAG: oligoendopeptidase F [Verrucomicrobiota bacterium]
MSETEVKSVPTRNEIDPNDTWDLTRLYETDEAWENDFKKLEQMIPGYPERKGTLGESADSMLSFLTFDREFDLLTERLYHYASLRTSEDGANDEYLQREGRMLNLLTKAAEAASFFQPELQAIPEDRYEAIISEPVLNEWKVMLLKIRRYQPHVLSTPEERLLAMGSSALHGYGETFGQLTNVDMKFGTLKDEKGQTVELSHGAFSSFLVKRDRDLRKNAFFQYYQEFDEHKFTVAATLAHSVKVDVFSAKARHYPSARAKALFADNVPESLYDNLLSAVRENIDGVTEYYELRKDFLGLDAVHAYDTYVPLVPDLDVRTTFDQACAQVLDSLAPLGQDYVDALRKGFQDRWVDRYETKGKRSGAFSSSSYGNPPYILMNYKEDVFSDMYTLAHEAGHSMHSWYSQSKQPYQYYQYPIFLAEVASTFNEELLTQFLLDQTDDPKMRAYIINRQIDDIRGTVIRQSMFAEFEHVVHRLEEEGAALTLDVFRQEYRKLLEAYHGSFFVIDEVLDLECLRIPHFYSAFYVYKYATGLSAAVALSQKVLAEGGNATERYRGFLSSGGSQFPLETLMAAGVDMTQPEPVAETLTLFKTRVKELRDLLEKF